MARYRYWTSIGASIILGLILVFAGLGKLLYGGSLLVYDDQTEPITQETNVRPRSGYGRAKLEAETQMVAMAEQASINFSPIRLPHVYGAKSLLFYQIRQGRGGLQAR